MAEVSGAALPVEGAQQYGGFGVGQPGNINFYDANPQDEQNYENALQGALASLQQRVAAPNWANIGAGFLHVGPGGFGAGLQGAEQALGQFVEQRRQMALPIAQMQAQLAQSKILMGQNARAAQNWGQFQSQYAGKTPPLDALSTFVAQQQAIAPDAPATHAASTLLQSLRQTQELQQQKQTQLLQQIQTEQGLATLGRETGDPNWQQHLKNAETLEGQLRSLSQPYPAGSPVPIATGSQGTVPGALVPKPAPSLNTPQAAAGAPTAPVSGANVDPHAVIPAAVRLAQANASHELIGGELRALQSKLASATDPAQRAQLQSQVAAAQRQFAASTPQAVPLNVQINPADPAAGLASFMTAYRAGSMTPANGIAAIQDMAHRGLITQQQAAPALRTMQLDEGALGMVEGDGVSGSPTGSASAQQGAFGAPGAPATAGSTQAPASAPSPGQPMRVPSSVPALSATYTTPQAAQVQQDQIKEFQADGQKQYSQTLENQRYTQLDNLIQSTQDLIRQNPKMAQSVLGLSQQYHGFLGGMLAALQGGVEGHVAGAGVNLHLPVNEFLVGHLSPQEKQLRDAIQNRLSQIALLTQQMGGINANTARNIELHLSSSASPDVGMQANGILYALGSLQNAARYSNMLHNRVAAIATGQDPQFDAKGSPTAYYDVFNNPKIMDALSQNFLQRQAQIDANYSKAVGGK
jgi:hypothetical protein